MADTFEPLLHLSAALNRTSVPYFLVGSVASGMRGVFRSTNDIDIVCDLTGKDSLEVLLQSLSIDFDCGLMNIASAVAQSQSFNILHKISFTKIDIFSKLSDLEVEEFHRAEQLLIPNTEAILRVATAEYVILAKLRWYVLGNRSSERQLEDVRSVVRMNRSTLDQDRLGLWAERLSLVDELHSALAA